MHRIKNFIKFEKRESSKTVLILAYYFPPLGGSGVIRSTKFVKYLHEFGWHPIVLTVNNRHAEIYDMSLEKDIPMDVRVVRSYYLELTHIEKKLATFVKRFIKTRRNKGTMLNLKTNDNHLQKSRTLTRRMLNFIKCWLYFPDHQIAWIPFCIIKALSLMHREKIDIIYTSSPPQSVLLAGYAIKKITNKSWVADFRDPWYPGWIESNLSSSRLRYILESKLRRFLIRNTDKIIVNTDLALQNLIKEFPKFNRDSILLIPNGFDSADFNFINNSGFGNNSISQNLKPSHYSANKFNIMFAGYIYYDTIIPFFEAVEQLSQENESFRQKVQIHILGVTIAKFHQWIQQHGLTDKVVFKGYLPHQDCLRILADSDVLLLLVSPEIPETVPAKLFEYMNLHKPILALVPEGMAAELIRKSQTGIIVNPENRIEIKQTLIELFHSFLFGSLNINPDESFIHNFERKTITKNLANVFDSMLKNSSCEISGLMKREV